MAFEFDGSPIGPYYGPNKLLVVQNDEEGNTYQLNIFPDLFNEDLRKAGKPLAFYYLPDSPRMAKYENGDYMFHFTKFAGVLTADDNIAVASPGQVEVAGGVLAFTSTLKIPDSVLQNALDQLKHEIKNNPRYNADKRFMVGDADVEINLGVVPIVDNVVSIANLSPENLSDPNTQKPDNPWLWKMQGEGKGTINPVGNNAYTSMLGQYPSQLVEAGFHGASSPIFVHNALKHKFYTGAFKASIHGDWSAIFNHFSTDLKASYFFVKGDIQLAFNSAVKDGTIKKSITMDTEVLTPEQEKDYIAQVDKTFDKFLDIAQKTIFDPAPPKIENAKADDPGTVGVSFSMKFQHDESHLTLDFEEEINETYIKDNVISAHMMGFYEKLQDNKDTEKKYFDVVHLDEGFRKIHVIASARAFWPDEKGQGGDPVDKLVLQVGYPDSKGAIVYKDSGLFMKDLSSPKSTTLTPAIWTAANKDMIVIFDFARQDNLAPEQQNIIYVKRQVRFKIRPEVEIPNQTYIFDEEKTTDHSIEVKADAPGRLIVGPVQLNTKLSDKIVAMVTFKKANRNPETLRFTFDNMNEPQYFEAWAMTPEDVLNWSYQVTMFLESAHPGIPSITYSGEEKKMAGSMPLIVEVPFPPENLKEQIEKLKELNANLNTDF